MSVHIEQPFILLKQTDKQFGEQLVLILQVDSTIDKLENQRIEQRLRSVFEQVLNKYQRPKEIRVVEAYAYLVGGKVDLNNTLKQSIPIV